MGKGRDGEGEAKREGRRTSGHDHETCDEGETLASYRADSKDETTHQCEQLRGYRTA